MKKYQLCLMMTLGLAVSAVAQSAHEIRTSAAYSSSSSLAETSDSASTPVDAPAPAEHPQAATTSGGVTPKEKTPVGSVTLSYVYLFQTSPSQANRSMMGFSAMPEYNITRHIGFQGDVESLYVQGVGYNQRRLILAAGPRYTIFRGSRFSPFVYGEGGEMRSISSQNNLVDWNPVAKGGVGVDMKVKHGIAFQLIPGEYQGERVGWNNQWNHSFSARAGITFNLFK